MDLKRPTTGTTVGTGGVFEEGAEDEVSERELGIVLVDIRRVNTVVVTVTVVEIVITPVGQACL